MIYGLIPVGGKGTRLGLPFSKEMLPLPNEESYRPVMDITVQNMFDAGATAIYAIHGEHFKEDIVSHYLTNLEHVLQMKPSFGGVLRSFVLARPLKDNDTVYLGLPDSVYFENMFSKVQEAENKPTLLCFEADDDMAVDRLTSANELDIKSKYKHNFNSCWFWAGIAFSGRYLKDCFELGLLDNLKEIGDLLNHTGFTSTPIGGAYFDTGTWSGYNQGMRAYDFNRSGRSCSI